MGAEKEEGNSRIEGRGGKEVGREEGKHEGRGG